MPGIAGLVTHLPRERAMELLGSMLRTMTHDPSHLSGHHVDEANGVYVGWVARPGSFCAAMPVTNETGTISLIYSGEDFPEPDTRLRLQRGGHAFGAAPAAYLVHLYEEDPAFLTGLNGRFHGVLVDRERGHSVLFNDRFGMHRIYHHESADAFYFAAEAKAILAVCPEVRRTDPNSLGEFISCGCVLENRSLFAGISILPPASAWTLRHGAVTGKDRYFSPADWENLPVLDGEEYYQKLREVFASNVSRYFGGEEAVGISLTGGLDSRMIMAWRQDAAAGARCYSFGGMYHECRDVAIARTVAIACGLPHQVISVGGEFLSRFAHYAERAVYLTDGCVSVSHSPDLYVNERASAIAPVRLTGNYGGEVLRQVRAFKPMPTASGLFSQDIATYKEAGDTTYRRIIQTHPLSFALFRQAPWHHYGLLSLEQTQVTLRSPFLDNAFVKTVFQAPASTRANNEISLRLISDGDAALGRIPTDRGLIYGDNGIEARARNGFIELTVKAEYAYDYGMPQWMVKVDRALGALRLDRLFLGRHKFYHFRRWYRHELSGYVKEILLDSSTLSRPIFQKPGLESMVHDHVAGVRNCTLGIHKALSLELLHRHLVDC